MAGRGGRGPLSTTPPEPDADDAPDLPPPPPATPRPPRGRPSWALVAVALAVALVSLAVAAAALLLAPGGDDGGTRADALEAARERGARLTTYDHRTLDEDFAAVLETATGPFEQEYRSTTEQLRPTFEQTRAVAAGKVVAAGIESADLEGDGPPEVVVVLAVDQVITTTGAPARTERNRIRMTLVRPDDTWLVQQVQRL